MPGQSACQIDNDYSSCFQPDPATGTGAVWGGAYVTAQQTATGETYAYTYAFPEIVKCEGAFSIDTTMTVNGTAVTRVYPVGAVPDTIVDPLGRTTSFRYMVGESWAAEPGQLVGVTAALGNGDGRSERRPRQHRTSRLRPRSRAPALPPARPMQPIRRAAPLRTGGSATSRPRAPTRRAIPPTYTYDPDHGGLLTETGPAPAAGARPAADAAQLCAASCLDLDERRRLCAGGDAGLGADRDQPVPDQRGDRQSGRALRDRRRRGAAPTYDYGPDSGPNNLLLRGQTVTATDGGVTTTLAHLLRL